MVELNIYNMKGQRVRTLGNQEYDRGIHNVEWNGKGNSGTIVGSGVYLYELRVNGRSEAVKKCLMLK
jgi:flagellar hook assembly protein FlgD